MIKIVTAFSCILLKIAHFNGQCIINPDSGGSWPQWPPIITDAMGDLILPTGVENDRSIRLESDQVRSSELRSFLSE